jgi:signal transduction histidine kinase
MQRAVHLNEILEETREAFDARLGDGIELRLDTDPGLWQLYADPRDVERMFDILVSNARDLMPRGGRLSFSTSNWELRPTSEYLAFPPGDYVRLTATHTGSVTEETARRIDQDDLTRGRQGPGSQMARLYGIVQAAGGYVLFRSLKGRGTTLDVCLPAGREPHREVQDSASMRRSTF